VIEEKVRSLNQMLKASHWYNAMLAMNGIDTVIKEIDGFCVVQCTKELEDNLIYLDIYNLQQLQRSEMC
jgi:hypothetical protein